MACSFCHEPGHYKSTCPDRPESERAAEKSRRRPSGPPRRPASEIFTALLSIEGTPTLSTLGRVLGVSRERARQLMNAHGLQFTRLALKDARQPTAEQKKRRGWAASGKAAKLRAASWRADGKCPRGGCERDDDHIVCSTHRAKVRASNGKLRDKRRAKHLCPRCGKLPIPGKKMCRDCLDNVNGHRAVIACPAPGDGQPAA